jgi:hypothetical protein
MSAHKIVIEQAKSGKAGKLAAKQNVAQPSKK